ncbi:MAG: peptidoglycan-binding protein [Johnsonella sp.]|nr:peptidoglycan-binding protein [Johnsonella sp.]
MKKRKLKKSKFDLARKDAMLAMQKYIGDKSNIKIIAGIAAAACLLVVCAVVALSSNFTGSKVATPSSAADITAEESSFAASVDIVDLSPTGALFPSIAMEVPTTEPVPEYIRIGVQHPIVKDLQERLMELGFMEHDEPTDYYGPVSEAAVKTFQRQNNLAQDGVIGLSTLQSIMAEDAKYYAAKQGDVGDDIYRIQSRLYELGYLADNTLVNGSFGEKTEEAVKKLQEINALEKDGMVGMKTLDLIYSDEVKANMLAYGEKSDVVLVLQKRLFELGYMTSTPDGAYGLDTSIAVKAFQSKNDQIVDGYLGPSTREAIMSSSAVPNGLTLGDHSEQVINIQKLLAKWGYIQNANISGYYGESTEAAIKAFQRRNGLTADGSAGAQTIAKLMSDNAVRPAPRPTPTQPRRSGSQNAAAAGNNNTAGPGGGRDAGSGGAVVSAPVYTGGGGVGTLLSVASSKVGSPYVWGAKGPNAFDCSGFVYWCLNNAGVNQSYLTSSGWRGVGRYTRVNSFGELQAGDIIVVRGHVGICAGGGTVIDASSSNGRVVTRSLSGWWQNNFIVGWRIF